MTANNTTPQCPADPVLRDACVPDGRRLCAHADRDGAGMHWLEAGQTCRSGDDDDDRGAAAGQRREPGRQQPPRAAGAEPVRRAAHRIRLRALRTADRHQHRRSARPPCRRLTAAVLQPGVPGGGPPPAARRSARERAAAARRRRHPLPGPRPGRDSAMTAPAAAGSAEAATCQRLRGHLAYLGLAAAAEALPGRAGRHRAPMAHYPPEHKGGEQAGHKAPTVGRYAASDSR